MSVRFYSSVELPIRGFSGSWRSGVRIRYFRSIHSWGDNDLFQLFNHVFLTNDLQHFADSLSRSALTHSEFSWDTRARRRRVVKADMSEGGEGPGHDPDDELKLERLDFATVTVKHCR